MKLSDRIRPGVECAPWVYEEVCCLEAERDRLKDDVSSGESLLCDQYVCKIHARDEQINGLIAERDQLRDDNVRLWNECRDWTRHVQDHEELVTSLRVELTKCKASLAAIYVMADRVSPGTIRDECIAAVPTILDALEGVK